MDEIEMLRQYGVRTARATSPRIDVTSSVLETLRHTSPARDRWTSLVQPLASVAAAGWLLAFSLGFFVQQALTELQDPISALVTPFVINLQ